MEWYHVCWPRLTAKRVEPVVSISWASCLLYTRYHVSDSSEKYFCISQYFTKTKTTDDGRDLSPDLSETFVKWGRPLKHRNLVACVLFWLLAGISWQFREKRQAVSWQSESRPVMTPRRHDTVMTLRWRINGRESRLTRAKASLWSAQTSRHASGVDSVSMLKLDTKWQMPTNNWLLLGLL